MHGSASRPASSPSSRLQRLRRFVSDFAGGVSPRDLQRLVERDVLKAMDELAGGRLQDPAEGGRLGWLGKAQLVLLGLAFKLAPVRRLVLALSLLATLLGFADLSLRLQGAVSVSVDFSPLWFLVSILLLWALLALELVDRLRVRDELEVARQLQRELLPAGDVELPGLDVRHTYRTANEVGGDFYDFALLPDGRISLVIGDASGHGIAAGLLMATAKAVLGVARDLDPDPRQVLSLLNRRLCETGDRRAFMTLFYGVLDSATGELDFACAGHPFPLLRRADGSLEELGEGALPLGIRPALEVAVHRTTLAVGDLLVLYTDGLPEAVGPGSGEAFGFDRLRRLASDSASADEVVRRALAALDDHLGGEALRDDVSLAALQRGTPAGGSRPNTAGAA